MKHVFSVLIGAAVLWALAPWSFAEVSGRPSSVAELREQLDRRLDRDELSAAAIGVKVVSLETGRTLFERDAGKLLKPASNAKLFTGALALDRLGAEFRIRTSLYATTLPDPAGNLEGDLLVYGRGDPTFAARFNGGDAGESLAPLANVLSAAGVGRVEGGLICDDTFFNGPPFGSTWSWEDLQYYYGAGASALSVDDNVVSVVFKPGPSEGMPLEIIAGAGGGYLNFVNHARTGAAAEIRSVQHYRPVGENTVYVSGKLPLGGDEMSAAIPVHNAPLFFAARFRDSMEKRGIRISGGTRSMTWPERELAPFDSNGWIELAYVESRPIGEIVTWMMKASHNLDAQLLLLQAGVSVRRRELRSETAGLVALGEFVGKIGIDPAQVRLEEGAGLSRGCLVTPDATVRLLERMARHAAREVFIGSLPIAGIDGTLRHRMKGTAAEGNVRGKTGSIRYVHCLSGYVTSAAGEPLAFAIFLNNYPHPDGRDFVDGIAVMLAEFGGHSRSLAGE